MSQRELGRQVVYALGVEFISMFTATRYNNNYRRYLTPRPGVISWCLVPEVVTRIFFRLYCRLESSQYRVTELRIQSIRQR